MHRESLEIGRELFGYKKDDVDLLLAALNRDLRVIGDENLDLIDENKELRLKLDNLNGISKKLMTALKDSEKTSELLIRQAKSDAETILSNAYHAASDILNEAETNKKRISVALSRLDAADRKLTEYFSTILDSYLNMIEVVSSGQLSNGSILSEKPSSKTEPSCTGETENHIGIASTMSPADKALIKAHIGPISDIEGVQAVWLCDNNGTILAYVAKPEVKIESIYNLLRGFSNWSYNISPASDSNNIEISQVFIKLKDLALVIQPIDGSTSTSIGAILSKNARFDSIALIINEKRERLSDLLSAISIRQV
jgi:cell division initiation protein